MHFLSKKLPDDTQLISQFRDSGEIGNKFDLMNPTDFGPILIVEFSSRQCYEYRHYTPIDAQKIKWGFAQGYFLAGHIEANSSTLAHRKCNGKQRTSVDATLMSYFITYQLSWHAILVKQSKVTITKPAAWKVLQIVTCIQIGMTQFEIIRKLSITE